MGQNHLCNEPIPESSVGHKSGWMRDCVSINFTFAKKGGIHGNAIVAVRPTWAITVGLTKVAGSEPLGRGMVVGEDLPRQAGQ